MDPSQQRIDALLERYLSLLDEYTSLRTKLSGLQSEVHHQIARANFSAERGFRYGEDQFDRRMKAQRFVGISMGRGRGDGEDDHVDTSGVGEDVPVYNVGVREEVKSDDTGKDEANSQEQTETKNNETTQADTEDKDDGTKEPTSSQSKAKKPQSTDPLRWFGLLTPPALRAAQASSVQAVQDVIPRLVSVDAEMKAVEIQVRRERKRRAKAGKGGKVGKVEGKGTVGMESVQNAGEVKS